MKPNRKLWSAHRDGRAEAREAAAYRLLARRDWQRRKGRFVRRSVRRPATGHYCLRGSPLIQNTSCTALFSGSASAASAIPLPP